MFQVPKTMARFERTIFYFFELAEAVTTMETKPLGQVGEIFTKFD
jgi:hypothetical protein